MLRCKVKLHGEPWPFEHHYPFRNYIVTILHEQAEADVLC